MAVPIALSSSSEHIAFTANWTAPTNGIVNNYFVDVATDANFTTPIVGSPFSINGNTTFSKSISGLQSNLNYYYRVRAEKTSLTGQGGVSNTILVRTLSNILPPGNCLSMDGTNDYISIPSSTGINNQFAR
jgi:hypothetical protein